MDLISESKLICCKQSDIYGRYLEANVNIKKGTLIFNEKALVVGPMRMSDLVCVGCHKELEFSEMTRCSRCKWPTCSPECMESPFHQDECKFFVENQVQVHLDERNNNSGEFGALTVLRALLLKLTNPNAWKLLNSLEHHNEIREKLPLWKENEELVVKVICKKWKLGHLFNSDEIHSICGILEVNSFELGETFSYRGIFPNSAMLAHNCVPNAAQFINKNGSIDIRATVNIPAGTPLFLTYALSIQGTVQRQKSLMDIKFFQCSCDRCNDPTELGTHLSSLKCQKCKIGIALREKSGTSWKCADSKCNNVISSEIVDKLIEKFYNNWEQLTGIVSQEKFLKDCELFFHPNHFIPFRAKFDLCQSYGREGVASIHALLDKDLTRKSTLCTDVLKVLDIVTPGHTITRGLILYELQATQLVISKRIFETGMFNNTELRKSLMNSMKILIEAIAILSLSPEETVEYELARGAKQETFVGLQCWIDCLQ